MKVKSVLAGIAAAGIACGAGAQVQDMGQLDHNMVIPTVKSDGISWYSPKTKPFRLAGFSWFEQDNVYRRLPVKPAVTIPKAVDTLASFTAGGQVSFKSNATKVLVRVKLSGARDMFHMASTGHSGFDLYLGEPGGKKFYAVTFLKIKDNTYEAQLYSSKSTAWKEFTLNFPLYNGVEELLIGLNEKAEIAPPSPYASDQKIVVYGGSTVQGACASRPGAYHLNILSRRLNMEIINLGFSGSGKLEPELAELMTEIKDPAVFFVEGERNSHYQGVVDHLENFINILRKKHPAVPIVILTANKRSLEAFRPDERVKILAFQKQLAEKMNVLLFDSTELLGDDFYECSVDGSHPTDLGFYRMAEGMTPFTAKLLNVKVVQ
jgi:hypothetical protein